MTRKRNVFVKVYGERDGWLYGALGKSKLIQVTFKKEWFI
jgi:hypothetical protein